MAREKQDSNRLYGYVALPSPFVYDPVCADYACRRCGKRFASDLVKCSDLGDLFYTPMRYCPICGYDGIGVS